MENLKKISVITVLNRGMRFYMTALKSYLYQTYPNTEWLIIDNTGKNIIRSKFMKYLMHENRIRILTNLVSLSPQDVLRQGVENTQGEYIAFLRPVDYWVKDKLSRQMAYMERYKAMLSHTSYAFGDNECHLLKVGCYHSETELNLLNYDVNKNPVSVSTMMFRRYYTPIDCGKFDEKTGQFDIMLLFLKSGVVSSGMSDVMTVCRPLFSKSEQLKIDQVVKEINQIDTTDDSLKAKVLEHYAMNALNVAPLKLDPYGCVGHDVIDSLIELQNFKI